MCITLSNKQRSDKTSQGENNTSETELSRNGHFSVELQLMVIGNYNDVVNRIISKSLGGRDGTCQDLSSDRKNGEK